MANRQLIFHSTRFSNFNSFFFRRICFVFATWVHRMGNQFRCKVRRRRRIQKRHFPLPFHPALQPIRNIKLCIAVAEVIDSPNKTYFRIFFDFSSFWQKGNLLPSEREKEISLNNNKVISIISSFVENSFQFPIRKLFTLPQLLSW